MENLSPSAPQVAKPPRIMAIDFGSKRIGLAVTDELGMTAQGLPTLHRTNKRNDFDQLRRTIKQYTVAEIVMGLPLRMSGEAGIQAEKVEAFAEELRARFKLPVHLFDERLTSVEANRVLDEADVGGRNRKNVVDQLAAVLILQAVMEMRTSRRD
jgi:putative holliday junction resolvase